MCGSRNGWIAWRRTAEKIKNASDDREFEFVCCSGPKATLEADTAALRDEMNLTPDDEKRIRGFQFLSQKPVL